MLLSPLNAILDDDTATRAGWDILDLARAFLDGGATFLQLRAKQRSSAWLFETAAQLVRMAAPFGALVVVNDRADIAQLA
ncbi:MAG TPA: thiamine phosphate synthase, partial [Vicinamibacterales bacterium]|nr:thiamine phosphate synthase [Vicinamibacterales bacterium]